MSAAPKQPEQIDEVQWGDVPDWAFSATQAILSALKAVDPSTYEHCIRVGQAAKMLALSLGLNEYQQAVAEFAGSLHDVGKMGIDKAIIHKPGRLTPEEFSRMQEHPVLSAEIIQPFSHDLFFQQLIPAVKFHHERFDGLGYPDCISGENIPLVSRLILIVDTVDAMTQNRAYRKGLPIEVVYDELRRFAGSQFDPAVTRIFLESHRFWGQQKTAPSRLIAA